MNGADWSTPAVSRLLIFESKSGFTLQASGCTQLVSLNHQNREQLLTVHSGNKNKRPLLYSSPPLSLQVIRSLTRRQSPPPSVWHRLVTTWQKSLHTSSAPPPPSLQYKPSVFVNQQARLWRFITNHLSHLSHLSAPPSPPSCRRAWSCDTVTHHLTLVIIRLLSLSYLLSYFQTRCCSQVNIYEQTGALFLVLGDVHANISPLCKFFYYWTVKLTWGDVCVVLWKQWSCFQSETEWDRTTNRTTNQSKDNVYTTGLMGLETGEAAVAGVCLSPAELGAMVSLMIRKCTLHKVYLPGQKKERSLVPEAFWLHSARSHGKTDIKTWALKKWELLHFNPIVFRK